MSSSDFQFHHDFQLSKSFRQSTVEGVESLVQFIKRQRENNAIFRMEHCFEQFDGTNGSLLKQNYVIRSLSLSEVKLLTTECTCHCDDWSNVYLMYDQNLLDENSISSHIKDQIRNCSFEGYLILGIIDAKVKLVKVTENMPSNTLKPGIVNNTLIKDTVIFPGARVYGNTILSDSFIGPNASVINCNSVSIGKAFSDVMEITLGPESGGGRPVNVNPENTLVEICDALGISNSVMEQKSMKVQRNQLQRNIILGHIKSVHDSTCLFISESACIESCASVNGAVLLPQSHIKNSTVESAFLQWKASIIDSTVSSTLLMECSDIGPKSVVASTIIGPDSHVSCGEVHCSLIGPNTNSHHQSLLISVLWPMGRGNVGYGSNIGSNHTGRIPDQECTSGEGVFWGLGCVIKFPVDLSHAYYSVVAAGVQLPPQSVAMPFSLIMNGVSGKNEIVPGWLIQSSPYTILRSENKFKNRRKAKRHDFYTGWKIIRPGIIDACWDARRSLLQLDTGNPGTETQTVYSKSDVPALGENIMSARGRKVGIEAYTNLIQRYALHGLFDKMNEIIEGESVEDGLKNLNANLQPQHYEYAQNPGQKTWPIMPWNEQSYNDSCKSTDHQLSILAREIPSLIGLNVSSMTQLEILQTLLQKTIAIEVDFFRRVKKSKMRDDKRGSEIIPNYSESHVLATQDPVVKMAEDEAEALVTRCKDILVKLDSIDAKIINVPHHSKL